MESDKELVRLAQRGDPSAFRTLVERYQKKAFALAVGIVKDADEAMDVVQEAFVKVHRYLPEFKGDSSFYTWLYRITTNLAIDALRQRRGERVDPDDRAVEAEIESLAEPPLAKAVDPQKAVLDSELGEQLLAALDQLPDKHRAILVLREVEGLSYEELAKVLKIPKGTVMSRLFHARLKMQQILRVHIEEDELKKAGGE
jgi:RNA polymerase sigma-70 factor (ECF subfamily)